MPMPALTIPHSGAFPIKEIELKKEEKTAVVTRHSW